MAALFYDERLIAGYPLRAIGVINEQKDENWTFPKQSGDCC